MNEVEMMIAANRMQTVLLVLAGLPVAAVGLFVLCFLVHVLQALREAAWRATRR